jgi:arylsulfatase A-like enzyme
MGKYLNRYRVFDSVPPGWDVWDGVNGQGYAEYNYGVNVNGVEADYADAPADYLTSVLSGKATSFIKYAARRSHPFFLEVATFAPHAPFVPAPQYAGTAQDLPYPATPAYDAQVRNPPPWLHQRQPLKPAAQATMLRNYQLRVEDDYSVDDLISNIEAELQAAGVANNTYIVFSSDNGYHMGEYRLLMGKQTAFDTDINVPLVVVGPHVPAGATVSALASSVDLAPTFEQLAGARIGAGVDGVSLLPLLSGHVPRDWQQAVLVEHHKPPYSSSDPDAQTKAEANPPSYEAVRTLRGLLVRYVGGAEEYYDTRTDPYELDNLGGGRAPLPMKRALHQLRYCHGATACQRAATAPFRVRSR